MSEEIDVVRTLALERLVSSVETLGAFVVDNISLEIQRGNKSRNVRKGQKFVQIM